LLLTEPVSWKTRFATATTSSAAFAAVVVTYTLLFHMPTTGTITLNHDRGWLLPLGLAEKSVDADLEKSDGIDALRLRALIAELPSGRERAAAYRNLSDIALPEIRAWYRPIYDRIMAMTEPELIEFVASHRPPVAWFAQMQKSTVMVNPATDLAASYSSTPPTSWTTGQTQTYSVTLTNTGSQTWNATGVDRVVLSVHFGTSDDIPGVGWATDQRFALPADLAPGGSVTLSVTVTAPSATGGYVLRQRMLTESEGDFGTAALSVYYYVGIPEGDDLGTRLYVEHVAANLPTFAREVLSRSLDTSFVRVARPRVPLSDGLPDIELGPEEHGWRTLTLTSGAGWHPIYWSRGAVLWEPGRLFFGWLDSLTPVPLVERALYFLVVLALLFSRVTGFPGRLERDLVATIAGGLIAYVVVINLVLIVRPVEAAGAWPLLCLTWAVCLKWIGGSIRRFAVASRTGRVARRTSHPHNDSL
jgi:hypothetical protein